MKRSEIFGCGLAVALCFGPASTAEEAGSLTNVGGLPLVKTADTCTKVFEIGIQHQRRGRIASALDSFAWIVVNLTGAPLSTNWLPGDPLAWNVKPGNHKLRLLDDHGRATETTVRVIRE